MASVKSISDSIESISMKKENLRKAFEDLQSHSSSLSSFTLQWKDIETHFDSIEKSIEDSFKDLELKVKNQLPKGSHPEKPQQSTAKEKESQPATIRYPELKSLCAKMDGKGLCSYMIANRKDLTGLRVELTPALLLASDPAKLVLDAMEGFQSINSEGLMFIDGFSGIRRASIVLLERLKMISPDIKSPVKEQAMELAMEWKQRLESKEINLPHEGLGFLQLLVTYGLYSVYDVDEILGVIVRVCSREHTKKAIMMCQLLDLCDKIPDLIQKLIKNGKRVDAVDFIHAFDLVEKFPPMPILETHIKASKRIGEYIIRRGKFMISAQNEAITKEVCAVRAVIKCIKEHKLESGYPIENLQKRVTELDNMVAANKESIKIMFPAANKRRSILQPPLFPQSSNRPNRI
eukprot:TRINITY_DN451_c0_g2_i1.p1 TRINITY_DN451_c0_g2~~TRINITY_DN451_c0_g2_i1.p1  ORF type:complete len:406 (+),score=65.20 TRINITY_DN451_c0_g2_i1:103-1320(+)